MSPRVAACGGARGWRECSGNRAKPSEQMQSRRHESTKHRAWVSAGARAAALVLAALSMAHVGSPDTFFGGQAGPYDVRISVRLPGVIPGRAQVNIRVDGATPTSHHVTVRAGQWNVGLKGAPPPETAAPVPGDPTRYAAELWFMTASSYQLAVAVDGPAGQGWIPFSAMGQATAAA